VPGSLTEGVPAVRRLSLAGIALLGLAGWVPAANACEPVFPLIMLSAGNLMYGVFSLPVVIAVKCLAFVRFEKDLNPGDAVKFMVLANLYSSLFGLLAALCFIVPECALASPVVIFLSARIPAKRLLTYVNWTETRFRISPTFLAAGLALVFLATVILFACATMVVEGPGNHYGAYWILKFAYVTLGISLSILLTACWEEHVIARLAARNRPESSYFQNVLRANYIAFIVLLLIGAAFTLPTRLRTPGFLF
jgi:hypothetical protein